MKKKFDGWDLLWKDLTAFITTCNVGYKLHKIQYGIEPDDWKPFSEVGLG